MSDQIAILMATYNGGSFIKEQLDSLLNQSYQDWVCYIHDDGSTDNTVDVIRKYCDDYKGKFILADYPKQGGAKKNFLSLLNFHKSKYHEHYIMFSDQDDVWLPKKVEATYQRMIELERKEQGKPCLVFTDLKVVDKSLGIISESFMQYSKHNPDKLTVRDMYVANPAPGCTMMINRELENLAVKYTDAGRIEMHDWWCMAIAATFGKIAYLNEATIMYRQHGNNTLGAVERTSFAHYVGVLKEVLSGRRFGETKGRIGAKRLLAKEMTESFQGVDDREDFMFVNELAKIEGSNKLKRMLFYKQNHLYNSLQHGIWIMICC